MRWLATEPRRVLGQNAGSLVCEASPGTSADPLLGGAGPCGLWLLGPGGLRVSAGAVVFRAGSSAHYWTESCPGKAVGSGGLKAAHLLVGESMSLPG